jgi:plastocyanin
MMRAGVALSLLAAGLIITTGSARMVSPSPPSAQPSGAADTPTTPTTWHVIAGFSQILPTGNSNTEAVNQFYPRRLTIYAGDRVTWTVNDGNEPHTVTFGPDPLLRRLENPQVQVSLKDVNGKQQLVVNPTVFFPSAPGPLVERDAGSATTLLNCGAFGPAGAPTPQSCTITFPHPGSFAYDCLLHSGIPGSPDMDGVITVIARPQSGAHTWTVRAGTGNAIDTNDGFVPARLTIHVGDRVSWMSGGELLHTVSFGLDPRKVPTLVPVGKGPRGPILAFNPQIAFPIEPKDHVYRGGVASSGLLGLTGNYLNRPGQPFVRAPFTLTFAKTGVYTYVCLIHPGMVGTITVLGGAS